MRVNNRFWFFICTAWVIVCSITGHAEQTHYCIDGVERDLAGWMADSPWAVQDNVLVYGDTDTEGLLFCCRSPLQDSDYICNIEALWIDTLASPLNISPDENRVGTFGVPNESEWIIAERDYGRVWYIGGLLTVGTILFTVRCWWMYKIA